MEGPTLPNPPGGRQPASCQRGSWEPTLKLWVFQVPRVLCASHLYTIISPERLESLSRPRTPIFQTRVANKDLLVSRWASHPPQSSGTLSQFQTCFHEIPAANPDVPLTSRTRTRVVLKSSKCGLSSTLLKY